MLAIIIGSAWFPTVDALKEDIMSKVVSGISSHHAGRGISLVLRQADSAGDAWSHQEHRPKKVAKAASVAVDANPSSGSAQNDTKTSRSVSDSTPISSLTAADLRAIIREELAVTNKGMKFLPRTDEENHLPKEGSWTVSGIYLFLAGVGCVVLYCIKPPNTESRTEAAQREWRNRARGIREPAEAEAAPSPPVPAEEFIHEQDVGVAAHPAMTATAEQLTGRWRGYYEQYGSSQRLCEFTLVFEGRQVSGDGVDDVGLYSIAGLSSEGCRRIAFSKQYVPASQASNGEVNYEENLGHMVEYRGVVAGPEVTTSGVRGTWFIQTSQYTGQGIFHIWPVEGLHSDAAMKASRDFMQQHPTFEVSTENVCVVCFDRTIDVLLDPCGHVVVCQMCAQTLTRHRCPICRTEIQQILSAKGAAMSLSDSSEQP